ncbi:MAG: vitamin K epoxide reductase family protein [Nanoarchaeota archaeon]
MKKSTKFLILVCILGILTTSYLTYLKFSSDPSTVCDINRQISCSAVNNSLYSTLFNIPLAVLGLLYFLLMLCLVIKSDKNREYFKIILFLSVPVLIYSLYLTYVEIAVLKTICLFCEFSKILMLLIIITALRNIYK